MISIKEIKPKDFEVCFELDSKTISLWSKKQWENEFKKKGVKVFGLLLFKEVIGVCVFQNVIDEAQINFLTVNQKFRRQGFGTYLLSQVIKKCEMMDIQKIFLEVSENNMAAENFYNNFDFFTVGVRKNYYQDGSNALLKEKKLIKN